MRRFSGDIMCTLSVNELDAPKEIVKCCTMDQIIEQHQICPKFVKTDTEGYAMDLAEEMIESIKEYRPVLSIAIYHNPKEFFEIKPYLQKQLQNYIFSVKKLTSGIIGSNCHSEIVLKRNFITISSDAGE